MMTLEAIRDVLRENLMESEDALTKAAAEILKMHEAEVNSAVLEQGVQYEKGKAAGRKYEMECERLLKWAADDFQKHGISNDNWYAEYEELLRHD